MASSQWSSRGSTHRTHSGPNASKPRRCGLSLPIHSTKIPMFKRTCVKYVDNFGVEHATKVEAGSLFEAAVRGVHKLDASFSAERMCLN